MSTNLGAAQLVGGQANPETSVNTATGRLDAAITEIMTVDLTNDVALTSTQYRTAFRFDVTPSGTSKTLTLPAIKRMVLIRNTSANAISVACGTTSIALNAGVDQCFYTDGTANGLVALTFGPASFPNDLAVYVPGVLADSQVILRFVAGRAFTFPSGFTGSKASAGTASTGTAVFSIKKNGGSIGTITFTTSGDGVYAGSGDSIVAGDIITVTGPASHDTTLADIALNILGTR